MIDNNVLLIAGGVILFVLILVAAAFIGAMTTIKGWIREVVGVKEASVTEISGQPVMVEFAEKFVTRTQFDQELHALTSAMAMDRSENKRDHENLSAKLGGQERGINSNLRELDRKVAALDERTLTTNSTLLTQGQKLDRLIEKLKA